ncbi:hypothetical protein Goklo_006309 [Gossypium klotzschianum]|uniref:Uncharacterized protein n=1 Tax=Gossypium klotzschianum TaxID=34286 RepID=A0A7J8VH45_9ROSI|nr:hypothetical protein [Gossypium klotzschianum]
MKNLQKNLHIYLQKNFSMDDEYILKIYLESQKPQQYYEYILVQNGSVLFKHYIDPKDPNFITHSTTQILKILRPRDWGENPKS